MTQKFRIYHKDSKTKETWKPEALFEKFNRFSGKSESGERVNLGSSASCIEGKILLVKGGPGDLPGKDPENEFFWRRAVELPGSFEEIDPRKMKKPIG